DDGADLVTLLHTEHAVQAAEVMASMEETTTGVIRLRAMERDAALKIPVIAVNDADTKYLFDNRDGTGQSTIDGIIRATGMLIAGHVFVVCGYGWCGRGLASRARGMGAEVVVTEVDPIRALEAAMDGYRVMPIKDAARVGDVFVTLTGDMHVIRGEHFPLMKDGAILANSGHFDIEIDLEALRKLAPRVDRSVRQHVDAYVLANGRRPVPPRPATGSHEGRGHRAGVAEAARREPRAAGGELGEAVGGEAGDVREGLLERDAEAAAEHVEIHTRRLPQAAEAELGARLGLGEPLVARDRRTATGRRRHVPAGHALVHPAPTRGRLAAEGVG